MQRFIDRSFNTLVFTFKSRLFAGNYFFWKVNFRKVNYFLMFGSVMKNKLENFFQYLIMPWKISWKITY